MPLRTRARVAGRAAPGISAMVATGIGPFAGARPPDDGAGPRRGSLPTDWSNARFRRRSSEPGGKRPVVRTASRSGWMGSGSGFDHRLERNLDGNMSLDPRGIRRGAIFRRTRRAARVQAPTSRRMAVWKRSARGYARGWMRASAGQSNVTAQNFSISAPTRDADLP